MSTVKKYIESFKCPSCGVSLNVLIGKEAYENKPETEIRKTATMIRNALPSDVLHDLTLVEKESAYRIVPKKFLGKDKFRGIMQVVKELHGEWISQGKTSYWKVPKIETGVL